MGGMSPITHILAGGGCRLQVGTDLMTLKLSGVDTLGAFALAEVAIPPQGGPPGLHTHPSAETCLVLDGELEFATVVDGQVCMLAGTAGTVVHIPGFAPHTFRNVGTTPARMLMLVTPADLEQFYLEAGVPVSDPAQPPPPGVPSDEEWMMSLYRKHRIVFLDPPLHR
jgi:quercetin dioxygenase-like cupin family protein